MQHVTGTRVRNVPYLVHYAIVDIPARSREVAGWWDSRPGLKSWLTEQSYSGD